MAKQVLCLWATTQAFYIFERTVQIQELFSRGLNPLRESQQGTASWETEELKQPAKLHSFKATGLSVDLEKHTEDSRTYR